MKTKPDRNNKIKKMNYLFLLWLIPLILFIVFGIPLLINFILFQSWPPTPSDLTNKEWLGFWASFIGSIIGGIATFIAVYWTLQDNKKFQLEQSKKEEEFRKGELPILKIDRITREVDFLKQENLSEVRVILIEEESFEIFPAKIEFAPDNKIFISHYFTTSNKFIIYSNRDTSTTTDTQIKFYCSYFLTNVGFLPAINVCVHIGTDSEIYRNKSLFFGLGVEKNVPLIILYQGIEGKEITTKFIYTNRYNKWYSQDFHFKVIVKDGSHHYINTMDYPKDIDQNDAKKYKELRSENER